MIALLEKLAQANLPYSTLIMVDFFYCWSAYKREVIKQFVTLLREK